MPKFAIAEIDRDYNAYCESEVKEFADIEEAMEYCKEQSWSGYYYFVDKELK